MSATVVKNLGGFKPDDTLPIRHVFIIFGGVDNASPIFRFFVSSLGQQLEAWANQQLAPKLNFNMARWDGSRGADVQKTSEGEALNFIRNHFERRGKLIIYGASAGGQMAINLCYLIKEKLPFFSFDQDRMVEKQQVNDRMSGLVKVDLLITADATPDTVRSSSPGGGERLTPRAFIIPDLVLRNVNHYEALPINGITRKPHQFETPGRLPPPENIDWTPRLNIPEVLRNLRRDPIPFGPTFEDLEEAAATDAHSRVTHDSLPEVENAITRELGLSTS